VNNDEPSAFCVAAALFGCAWGVAQMQNAIAADAPDRMIIKAAPGAVLSQPEISACSEEIRRTRSRWKYWPGEASEAVARFARVQKELFEGRCAGHPQARAYVTAANRMLEHTNAAANASSSSGGFQPQRDRFAQDRPR
jgi:hypothetical protein